MPYHDLDDKDEVSSAGAAFSAIVMVLIVLAILLMSSCTMGYATGTDGTKTFVGAVGGKGAAKSKHLALNWDNEGSFRDATILAAVGISAAQTVATYKAGEVTKQVLSDHSTKQAINASNNAAAVELGEQAADVTKTITIPK